MREVGAPSHPISVAPARRGFCPTRPLASARDERSRRTPSTLPTALRSTASPSSVMIGEPEPRGHRHLEPLGRHSVKAYLLTTGTIFGLFAAGHVFELVAEWRPPASDPWFTVGIALIIGVSGALSVWAFRLLKGIGSSPLV